MEAGQTISLVPPQLLISWKAHLDSVADILYVDSLQLVISAGQDRDVKAWKLSGDAIGTDGPAEAQSCTMALPGPDPVRTQAGINLISHGVGVSDHSSCLSSNSITRCESVQLSIQQSVHPLIHSSAQHYLPLHIRSYI